MLQNKYDDPDFFNSYSKMERSVKGLGGAGEWHVLKTLLPDFAGKHVLDLGCGYGWHCRYAAENGASAVTGVDISEKMLSVAAEKSKGLNIRYIHAPLERLSEALSEHNAPQDGFDIALSSLAFHYVADFNELCRNISSLMKPCSDFVFSIEHPVFTAHGPQDWIVDESGNALFWPVDNYFIEGARQSSFLGHCVTKYHRTLTAYVHALLDAGFALRNIVEPVPDAEMLDEMPDELRRPMMLIIAAKKL